MPTFQGLFLPFPYYYGPTSDVVSLLLPFPEKMNSRVIVDLNPGPVISRLVCLYGASTSASDIPPPSVPDRPALSRIVPV